MKTHAELLFLSILCIILSFVLNDRCAAQNENEKLPIRALLLGVPDSKDLPLFTKFIREVLPEEGVNVLVVRFRYQYQFESHPELADSGALSKKEVKQILQACKDAQVRLIPKMNFLGHQSNRQKVFPLLTEYPEFDETPQFQLPVPYVWPNENDFYCKSYCPSHPDLHPILFSLMDELIEVCEADAFHVGMDEVFYLADSKCPRCRGRDRAELYAEEVTRLHNHLKSKNIEMWMWGDRFLDGKTTGLGMWEASMNATSRAIDLVPKDIMICDWHYRVAPPTPGYFALKGFNVLACPYTDAEIALAQLEHIMQVKKNSNRIISSRLKGVFQTSWGNAGDFIRAYYGEEVDQRNMECAKCFKTLFKAVREIE